MSTKKPDPFVTFAQNALEWIGPSVESLIKELGETAAHAVILDPRQKYVPQMELPILAERTYGEREKSRWSYEFDHLARGKTQVCWRTGRSNRDVIENAPWLLKEGDVKFPGGIVRDGLVAALSGFEWQLDEAFSDSGASLFWAQARIHYDAVMTEQNRIYI